MQPVRYSKVLRSTLYRYKRWYVFYGVHNKIKKGKKGKRLEGVGYRTYTQKREEHREKKKKKKKKKEKQDWVSVMFAIDGWERGKNDGGKGYKTERVQKKEWVWKSERVKEMELRRTIYPSKCGEICVMEEKKKKKKERKQRMAVTPHKLESFQTTHSSTISFFFFFI